jgi:threonine dehydratase
MLGLRDVQAAADRVRPYVVRTPLERSATLSQQYQTDVWLKYECFQLTGSFKLRGALNALLLSGAPRVVTVSAGNHGLGVARAAQLLGSHATVVLPTTASPAKIAALETSGAELVLHGADYDEAELAGRALATERDEPFISAYNDPSVIAGGGTIALEILEDLPAARAVVVPVGGGGLISGIGLAAHGLDPQVAVDGVQSVASPALYAALEAGHLVPVEVRDSLADGLAGNVEAGSITFDLVREHVRRIVLVDEAAIAEAMRFLLEYEHVLAEGSAAIGVAALRRGQLELDGPTVLVVTGRNVAAAVLRQFVYAAVPA